MKKKKDERTIRSSVAEYLTYVASIGDQQDSIEMRYEVHGYTAAAPEGKIVKSDVSIAKNYLT